MRVRAIDANNDWLFGKGQSDYRVNNDAIGQNIQTELQSFLGDCFFALSDGIDWFNLSGSKNVARLQLAINAAILNVDGVVSIVSSSFSLDANRHFSVSYAVNTIYTGNNPNLVLQASNIYILTEGGDNLTTEDGGAIEGG
jgi:hypothetical protein